MRPVPLPGPADLVKTNYRQTRPDCPTLAAMNHNGGTTRKRDERGVSAVEYALITILCAITLIVGAKATVFAGTKVTDTAVCNQANGYHCCKVDVPDPACPPTP